MNPLRITCISDTHEQRFDVGSGDVLIHAGDLTWEGRQENVRREAQWLKSLKFQKKLAIAGNHDWMAEKQPDLYRLAMEEAGVDYMLDQKTTVSIMQFPDLDKPLKVWGAPWQPRFYDWAFNVDRGDAIKAKWDLIPAGIDILVTHGPPLGVLDRAPRGGNDIAFGYEHVGCWDLGQAVKHIKPKLHVFGHIHADYGHKRIGDTLFVNASNCNESYSPVNRPIVVEYSNGKFEIVG